MHMCVSVHIFVCNSQSFYCVSWSPKKTNSLTTSKTSPYMTRLHVHNNTETLVSCPGHQRPSAVPLRDTKHYTVWHNQTYLRAKRQLVLTQPLMCQAVLQSAPYQQLWPKVRSVTGPRGQQRQQSCDSTLHGSKSKFLFLFIISCLCKWMITYRPFGFSRQHTAASHVYTICKHCTYFSVNLYLNMFSCISR